MAVVGGDGAARTNRHAVAFQQSASCAQVVPRVVDTHRHCSAAADEQAHALHCGREHTLPLLLLLRIRSNKPDIHSRHAHEHGRHEATTAAYVVPNLIRVEF